MRKLFSAIAAMAVIMASCKKEPVASFDPNVEIDGVKFEFVEIPAGTFKMGSPKDEKGRYDDESQHEVTITKNFYMGIYEVSQEQWKAVMGEDHENLFKGKELPADSLSWEDTQEFIKELNKKTGRAYRLPTEAEWEYACRAGSETPFNTGEEITSTDQANFYGLPGGGEYLEKTVNVNSFEPNEWGLYNMHGNVWEWCQDWYAEYDEEDDTDPQGPEDGTEKTIHGGGWDSYDYICRSACRGYEKIDLRYRENGFRLVLTKP